MKVQSNRKFSSTYLGKTLKSIESFKSNKQKIEVVSGYAPSSKDLKLEVLYEHPNLVAWVGKKDERGRVQDAVPIFLSGGRVTALSAGVILLTDISRDIAVENRFAGHNFSLANVGSLKEHINTTYGDITAKYFENRWLNRPLPVSTARFVASRIARILKVNYLTGSKEIDFDKSRIILKSPFTVLTTVKSGVILKDFRQLSFWLGNIWIEAEGLLTSKRPDLMDRSKYFQDKG